MSFPILLIVLGAILVYGGIKGYSIRNLFLGQLVPRTPPNPNSPPNAAGAGGVSSGQYSSPITPQAQFARIDQGVDYSQTAPYASIGSGVVERIATGWAGGTGKAVYVKLDNPVLVNGRTYDEFYVAETTPIVRAGQKVNVGQPLTSGGSAELGFLIGGKPATLQGGLGAGTVPTQAGKDFYSFVQGLLGH